MRLAAFIITLLLTTSCSWLPFRHGVIKVPGLSVKSTQDAGTPATLQQTEHGDRLTIPAGSKILITKIAAQPATPKQVATAAVETTEIIPTATATWERQDKHIAASTGTIDTSVALAKVTSDEKRPLLYASIAAAFGAAFFIWSTYPTPAIICGIASVSFFMAWKVSDLPNWFWVVGLLASGIALALYLGHERGEKSASLTPPEK